MKRGIKNILMVTIGIVIGLSFIIPYAGIYNSEEISYDTSTSGAVQSNVKDALDFLYNKTKSGAASECPENMSCVEKPGVVLNVSGLGSVNKGTVYVGLNESNIFTVTPNSGYTLHSISCDNGYTLGSFKTLSTEAMNPQEITITNPGTTTGATCNVKFSSNEINVSSLNLNSTYKSDTCNSNDSGCICYQIKNNSSNFTYENHTGCNFKSTSCYYTYNRNGTFNCTYLTWDTNSWREYHNSGNGYVACSGVITCAT